MNAEIKQLLEKVILVLKNDQDLYNTCLRTKPRDGDRFTVLALWELASNHLFDDDHKIFGITELEGWKIRHYFENPYSGKYGYSSDYFRAVEDMIVDLYRTFPDVFDGESKNYLQIQHDLSRLENVPLFEKEK